MSILLHDNCRIVILKQSSLLVPEGELNIAEFVDWAGVRIVSEQDQLLVEDVGELTSTSMDGVSIQGQGLVKMEPLAEMQSGEIKWTMVPLDWLWIESEDVVFCGQVAGVVNYATLRSGVPVVNHCAALNVSEETSTYKDLLFEIPGYTETCEIRVQPVESGSVCLLDSPAFKMKGSVLKSQSEPSKAKVKASCGEAGEEKEIDILAAYDWPYDPIARRSIAAFVLPRDPSVEKIVLDSQTGKTSLLDIIKRGEDNAANAVTKAIYDHLATCSVVYEEPAAWDNHQVIRLPSAMFDAASTAASGTCLDLSLLVAGCLENLGLCPLIVFLGGDSNKPAHALVGCWTSSTPGFRPIIKGAKKLLSEIESGAMIALEATGFAEGAEVSRGKLSFDDAVQSAIDQIRQSGSVWAVDVMPLRPPYGTVTPLRHPLFDPIVAISLEQAQRFARAKMSETLETVHLVYGLLATGGKVTSGLIKPESVSAIGGYLSQKLPQGEWDGEPKLTRNYRTCLQMAEQCAELVRGSNIKEEHVWWAILEAKSSNLIKLFAHFGVEINELRESIVQFLPRVLLDIDQSSVAIDTLS